MSQDQDGPADPLSDLLADAEIWRDDQGATTGADRGRSPDLRLGSDPSLDDILGAAPGVDPGPASDVQRDGRGAEVEPPLDRLASHDVAPGRSDDPAPGDLADLLDPTTPAAAHGALVDVPPLEGETGRGGEKEPRAPRSSESAKHAVPASPASNALAPSARDGDRPRRSPAATPRAPAGPATPSADAPRRRQLARPIETDDLDRLLRVGSARPTARRRWRTAGIWVAVLVVLAWAALQPYPFEVGGEFAFQPLERAEARSRTDGEIIEINVGEGDRVEAGEVMAVLSNWDELRDVALNEADGARLRADLAALMAGASPEQVEVARRAVATAELRVRSAQRALDREQALFEAGTIAEATLDDTRAAHDLALASRDEAQAALAVVTAPPRQPEIDSLNAALARNAEELAFSRLLLEYTNIRAPVGGQVVSSLQEVPLGAFLATGGLFAELEDNSVVIAEVEVPETTISEVAIGAPAELRLWSDPETAIEGTVRSVAPRAEERDFGWVIRVQVEVPNLEGRLAANMTGFAKISAAERPAWQAFSRAIERFVVIELWSWVP